MTHCFRRNDAVLQQDIANSNTSRQRCLGLLKAPVSIPCVISGFQRVIGGVKIGDIDRLPPLLVIIHSTTGLAAQCLRSRFRRSNV